jgi:hypothetical protein
MFPRVTTSTLPPIPLQMPILNLLMELQVGLSFQSVKSQSWVFGSMRGLL